MATGYWEEAGLTGTFKVVTLGCKVNQYESAFFEESLRHAGWQRAARESPADVLVVNTCIVTQKAAHQSRQEIRKAIRENPGARVAAVGCYAQRFPEELERIDGISLIANNRAKTDIPRLLKILPAQDDKKVLLPPFGSQTPFDAMPIKRFPGRTRAYLKIQDGCQSFCSYCIVPYTRGPYRSLPPDKTIAALETFAEQGYREVVITGIHLGKYGVDLEQKMNLERLLKMIGKEALPLRIRLSSLEPQELGRGIIQMAAAEPWLCPHFHIPLQSGDDQTLKRMNRQYDTRDFAKKIDMIHSAIPEGAIGVDVMAGFPGEDDRAHQNALSLIDALPVSYLHVFPFSPRKGTPAWHYKNRVPAETTKKRAAAFRVLGRRKRKLFYEKCMAREFNVLVEGICAQDNAYMTGLAENYMPFLIPRKDVSPGRIYRIGPEKILKHGILGKLIPKEA
jgi:threonylcarbamoyladenosine tRNA methylthiotransferase MtaB